MNFLLDHDVPDEMERLLRYWKHDVRRLREVLSVTAGDRVIFDFAQEQDASSSVAIEITF